MLTVTQDEFLKFVEKRYAGQTSTQSREIEQPKEKVVRPDQRVTWQGRRKDKTLATCPVCDAVVDSDILHPFSGLCPICHDATQL